MTSGLRDPLSEWRTANAVGRQLLPFGHVDGYDDVAAVGLRRRGTGFGPLGRVGGSPSSRSRARTRRAPIPWAARVWAPGSALTRTTQRRRWPSLRVAVQGTSAAVSASMGSRDDPHGVDRLAPFVDLCGVDEVPHDGADAYHLGRQVAEHLLRAGGEERDSPGRVDAQESQGGLNFGIGLTHRLGGVYGDGTMKLFGEARYTWIGTPKVGATNGLGRTEIIPVTFGVRW